MKLIYSLKRFVTTCYIWSHAVYFKRSGTDTGDFSFHLFSEHALKLELAFLLKTNSSYFKILIKNAETPTQRENGSVLHRTA
jgi:hypothetical protein